MKPVVDVLFGLNQDFYHASSLYAGLNALAQRGEIWLRFQGRGALARDLTDDPLTVCLQVESPGLPKPLLIAIDLHDQSDVFSMKALRLCNHYLKRSFYAPDLAGLPVEVARKVSPFGLNYACRTTGSTMRLFRAAASGFGLPGFADVRRLARHLILPKLSVFEQEPTVAVEPTIVFQTRVWEAWDSTRAAREDSEAINEGRVTIIRALKEAFGDRFRGGLVPTPLALARYPREVSPHPSRPSLYAAMSKRNLIGIYTPGMFCSTAFKLPEYLAASQCIVADSIRNELPAPLVTGKNFLAFTNADECVAACSRLLADKELAATMRNANHTYYRSEVEPSVRTGRLLERCINMSRHQMDCESAAGSFHGRSEVPLASVAGWPESPHVPGLSVMAGSFPTGLLAI